METVRVAAAIIANGGKVFAAHRKTSQSGPGWEFPGGRIEDGETPEQALRREISEELGVRLTTVWFLDTVEHDYPSFHISMDCFVCELAVGEELELREHDEGRWFDRNDLVDVEWLPADTKVARTLGAYWDQIFASSHL